ncbi:hypothetical protein C8R46DRAFT_1140294 [Mycena filopes]|nr:hypothetical protein C8R46DRAFT_1140294 [Mycena filopes]
MSSLPSHFTSLYRLFLRTSSASVLHQKKATTAIRKLWRPVFEDAAKVTTKLQAHSLSPTHRRDLELWLQAWHLRIDNTLALLYTASKSHGVPHQLTRNLAFLARSEQLRLDSVKRPKWEPDLPSGSPEYRPLHEDQHSERLRIQEEDAHGAWDALEEVVRMAEGRNELSLGKVVLKVPRLVLTSRPQIG